MTFGYECVTCDHVSVWVWEIVLMAIFHVFIHITHVRINSPQNTYTLPRTRVIFRVHYSLLHPHHSQSFFFSSTLSIKILFCSFFFVIPGNTHFGSFMCKSFSHLFWGICSADHKSLKIAPTETEKKNFCSFFGKQTTAWCKAHTHYTTHWTVEKWIFV